VNYRVLGDHHPTEDQWVTSAQLCADEQDAREARSQHVRNLGGYDEAQAGQATAGRFAYWPPR
jgi:hypothetical protein